MTRWGIIGTGRVASDSIGPAIAAAAGSELIACAGRNRAAASAIVEKFEGKRVYSTHEELVADREIDLVYVATANALHKDAVIAAARAGKHVLCEKPLALTVED